MGDWKNNLKRLSRKVPKDHDEYFTLIKTLEKSESDRGCVLIAASMLEAALEVALRSRIVIRSLAEINSIFDYDAPLGTFSAKISVAYVFGPIDLEIKNDLTRIRLIRNVFAHAKTAVDFSSLEIDLACQPLSSAVTKISRLETSGFEGVRGVFLGAVAVLLKLPTLANIRHPNGMPRAITYADIEASMQKSP